MTVSELDAIRSDIQKYVDPEILFCGTDGQPIHVRFRGHIETLLAEVERLRQAITQHHAQKADDRCHFDDDVLYAAAGLPPVDRRVGDKAAMLANCERFLEQRCEGGGPWKSYAELEAELAQLREVTETTMGKHLRELVGQTVTSLDESVTGVAGVGVIVDAQYDSSLNRIAVTVQFPDGSQYRTFADRCADYHKVKGA